MNDLESIRKHNVLCYQMSLVIYRMLMTRIKLRFIHTQ